MRKFITVLVLVSALGLGLVASAAGRATTTTTSQIFPIDIFVFVPCANGGSGESVELTGSLHVVSSVTMTGGGGVRFFQLVNPQGITGTGSTTRATYHGTGETLTQFTAHVGSEQTYVNNFKIIGQGPGNNFLVHETFHVTVNANGTVTASVDNFSITCR